MTLTLARPDLENPAEVDLPIPQPRRAGRAEAEASLDVVDRWGIHSFPASDPPANW